MNRFRRIRLDQGTAQHFFCLGGQFTGPSGSSRRSVEQLARPIDAKHPLFGKVELNEQTFRAFVKNFNDNVYGQEIYLDRNHNIGAGVQGTIRKLFVRDGRLLAEIEWTDLGIRTFQEDGFKYFSIDFTDDYINPETGKNHGPVLFGAALTPRPFIKNMKPTEGPGRLMLSEGRSVFIPDYLHLTEGADMNEFLKKLREKLAAKKLAEELIALLVSQAESACKTLAEGSPQLAQLQLTLEAEAVKVAEHMSSKLSAGHLNAEGRLTKDEITALIGQGVATALAAADSAKQFAEQTLQGNRKLFTDTVTGAQGLTDATRQLLLAQADAVTATMTADQVKRLADSAIKMGNDMEVRLKKAAIGLSVHGNLPIVQLTGDGIGSKVHGFLRERLQLTNAFGNKSLRLAEEKDLTPFARQILGVFDQIHGPRLDAEHKLLAGDGSTNIADSNFPVVAQRQVIVELLADLRFLSFVSTVVDPNAQATLQIPYEERNVSNIKNGGRVYEGQPIGYAGVKQKMDIAYVVPRKIAMLVSNEMLHFSRVAQINWEVWGRNIASNARLMRDLICADIANTLQRTADSVGATAIVDEAITAQVNGTRTVFKTAQFPVVRPHQNRDLQGTAVGAAENPIVVTVAGSDKTEYDGTGTQPAGNYFEFTDWNLGYFRIVNQAGAVQTLANATAVLIDYSWASNVQKFDTDNGAVDLDKHLNGLLNAIGDRKAVLQQQRYVAANFAIMSQTLHNTVTKAARFEADSGKLGTGLNNDGDLAQVKGIPVFGTNQPGVDLGDTRILLGERGTMTYGVAKPFATGTPFEVVEGSSGKPTGEKQAYGEEYSSIHVPVSIRNRLTSVIAYSATARAAV